ncbi:MAG: hypothetical protein BWY42_01616 [Candidatus Omnitrophica bacterium ADurb.Bin277]|nr:MAG: hypothetical protein BWY42_01616 [Candidatus Omnitrophica bacterium ADurb.Bin277]
MRRASEARLAKGGRRSKGSFDLQLMGSLDRRIILSYLISIHICIFIGEILIILSG